MYKYTWHPKPTWLLSAGGGAVPAVYINTYIHIIACICIYICVHIYMCTHAHGARGLSVSRQYRVAETHRMS